MKIEIKNEKFTEDIQMVGFFIENEEYAIPILSIQEIIKPVIWTRIPQVPSYILGVFNLRGAVLPLIDLRQKFGFQKQKNSDDSRIIVLKNKEEVCGFVIDKLTQAISIKESNIETSLESIKSTNSVVSGVAKLKDRIVTILKVEKLLERED